MAPGSSQDLFCIFAKPPLPGLSKTRLAAGVGFENAAGFARAFLEDAIEALEQRPQTLMALATTEVFPDTIPLPPRLPVLFQGEGDLGARIERVVRLALERAPFVYAIGADSPGLPSHLLDEASTLLRKHDAVLGPAKDGGFYLLGLKRCPQGLLDELPWSRSDTFQHTLARLRARGFDVALLDPWFDVDFAQDLPLLARVIARGEIQAERSRAQLEGIQSLPNHRSISVIMPALNEERRIVEAIQRLSDAPGIDEIIVVDGGSRDNTVELARNTGRARVLESSEQGRAPQMNAGASVARGEVLLFLHADVKLPRDASSYVREALDDPGVVGGAFRTWTVDDTGEGRMRWLLHLADFRSRYTRLPYGDQAIFVRRQAFDAIGGYPDLPLMEDLEFSVRLRRLGRIHTVGTSVRVAGRRFIARPVFFTVLTNLFPLLYYAGVPTTILARLWKAVR